MSISDIEHYKFKPCDFCHVKDQETAIYVYRSVVLKKNMKVRLCKLCAEKEKSNILEK